MSIHHLGVMAMLIGLGVSTDARAGEPCLHRLRETRCDSCQDSDCHDHCARGRSLGFQIGIPSIRWGISVGCGHSDCRHGCLRRDCSLCCRREPPRAPLAFSVPAVAVPQQAVAVNPVLPAQSQPACPTCPPRSQAQSEMDRLILETLLKRLETAEARSHQAPAAAAGSATNGSTKSTEQRLSELEHRLDRILDALEQ